MSRRKSNVVLPQPIRRSVRLISTQSRDSKGRFRKDRVLCSEPPSKTRREVLRDLSKRLVYSLDSPLEDPSSKKSPGLNSSSDGFPSLRRSLRLSSRECSDAKPALTPSSRVKSSNVSSSCTLRRSPRFSSRECSDANKEKPSSTKPSSTKPSSNSTKPSSTKPSSNSTKPSSTKPSLTPSSRAKSSTVSPSCTLRRSPRFSSGGGGSVDQSSSSNGRKSSGNSVLSRCSTKSVSSERGKSGDGVKSRDRSRIRLRPKTKKQRFRGCCDDDDDDDEEEEVRVCLSERKRMRIAKPNEEENSMPKVDEVKRVEKEEEEEGLKTKNKLEKGWTKELELALQGAYLTVKPSPNFWKKVAKMVPGKSAQECFDRVNSALITPRQPQPRRPRKTNLSTIPQFSLSASKLLKPISPKTKIQQRRNNLSKKTMRHLLEKQNHMEQGLGYDLFSVLEPSTTCNFLSTPVEKGQSLPKILETPVPCSSKDQTTLVSPPVLKQVKNKALHEKYIDHLHIREAKRKAESTRLVGKENIRPTDIQKKDSVRAAKDALFFDVQDAIQKLKGLEAENSSSPSEFCYDTGETEEEDEI